MLIYKALKKNAGKRTKKQIIQIGDIPKCSEIFWEHPPPAGDAEILPLRVPVDRVFDVQWNPPGHPELYASYLQTPFGDDWGNYTEPWARDGPADLEGYYTFVRYHQDGKLGLLRKKEDGTLCSVFHEVAFISISDEVLMMNGDPGPEGAYGGYSGGGFGTLVKGTAIPAGNEDGNWETSTLDEYEMSGLEWLLTNFGKDDPQVVEVKAE